MTPGPRLRPPSVERLLGAVRDRLGDRDRDALLAAARSVVADERERLGADGTRARTLDELAAEVERHLDGFGEDARSAVAPVLNATGVILHTNLGRAPWPRAAIEAAAAAAAGYAMLELDLDSGRRGGRSRVAEEHLAALTGAADALVTNNAAAGLALAVALGGRRTGVVVSRGELVEIGGGVRIPEVVRRAGARLIEVGTTNRTRVEDYAEPLASGAGRIVLRVHPSNFRQSGFVESPDAAALAALAHRYDAILVDDLGSGALLDTAAHGLAHEPMPRERLEAGADVVVFSGDKLVGGPQAGLLAGRADLVARMRRDPLARAMRPDKATLAGVAATLALYRSGRATAEVPVWRMIAVRPEELRARAEVLAGRLLEAVAVVPLVSTIGGGALTGETLPSFGLALADARPDRRLAALRRGAPPVVARIDDGRVVLDLRTVEPERDGDLATAIEASA